MLKTYLKMSSFLMQHYLCYKGSDDGCSREPPAEFGQNDLELAGRKVIDAGAGCGSEYVVMDNDWKELAEAPETDEASRVDAAAAESRQSVGAEDAVVAVVSLAVLDGDDAGTEMLVEAREIIEKLCSLLRLFPLSVGSDVWRSREIKKRRFLYLGDIGHSKSLNGNLGQQVIRVQNTRNEF
jgi:hypothetical protein